MTAQYPLGRAQKPQDCFARCLRGFSRKAHQHAILGGPEAARRKAMMQAIRLAARETTLFRGTTLTNGLRCIGTFERINGVAFDPFNPAHLRTVDGMAVHEAIHRKLRLMKTTPRAGEQEQG